jgi:hypothetical protein
VREVISAKQRTKNKEADSDLNYLHAFQQGNLAPVQIVEKQQFLKDLQSGYFKNGD